MEVIIGILIGAVAGWFARDAIPALRREQAKRHADGEHADTGSGAAKPSGPAASDGAAVIHTVKSDDGWEVRREGDDAPLASFDTKAEAQVEGRQIAKDEAAEYVVHRVDDTVSEHRDYTDAGDSGTDAADSSSSDSGGSDSGGGSD